jgi:hypothetical protein
MEDGILAEAPEVSLPNIGRAILFTRPLSPAANVTAAGGAKTQDQADCDGVSHC